MNTKDTVTWFDKRNESAAVRFIKWISALIIAFLFNFLVLFVFPEGAVASMTEEYVEPEEETFEIQLIEEEEFPQYVETNPDTPENEPDDTPNISDRNQQAAQEDVVGPENEDTPFLQGEEEDSMKIVEGQIPQEQEATPEIQYFSEQENGQQSEDIQRQQSIRQPQEGNPGSQPSVELPSINELPPSIPPPPPTPDFIEEVEPESEDGLEVPIIEDNSAQPAELVLEESKEEILNINIPPSVAQQLAIAQPTEKGVNPEESQEEEIKQSQNPTPKPRPRLSPKVLPGPLMMSQTYAARMGDIGYDAKFSQFGYYLQQMFETIQLQWYSLLADVTIGQENRPANVIVRYTLDRNGKVKNTTVLETNSGQLGTLLCQDAIEARAPFGLWTEQMVDQLGEETDITIRFIYY